jgi:hypothetical protein
MLNPLPPWKPKSLNISSPVIWTVMDHNQDKLTLFFASVRVLNNAGNEATIKEICTEINPIYRSSARRCSHR